MIPLEPVFSFCYSASISLGARHIYITFKILGIHIECVTVRNYHRQELNILCVCLDNIQSLIFRRRRKIPTEHPSTTIWAMNLESATK